jgi:hypothetical protein
MKKITFLLILGMVSFYSFSQSENKTITFTLGGGGVIPLGKLGDTQQIGYGVSGSLAYGLNENSAITLSVGYISFTAKNVFNQEFGALPIKAGYRVGVSKGIYVEPQIGFTSWNDGNTKNTGFTYAPKIGYVSGSVDGSIRYETTSINGTNLSFLAFGVGYKL